MPAITSTSNPLVKRARKLRSRKGREEAGAMLIEGIQPVWQSLDHDAEVTDLLVAPELLTSDAARDLVARQGVRVAVHELAANVFEALTDRDHPSGLAAIARIRPRSLDHMQVERGSLFVALEEVGNPGNLGAIARTADAVGARGLVCIGAATDPWSPQAIKASMGTLFALDVCRASGTDELFEWTDEHGVRVLTTSARAETDYREADYTTPLVLLLGSEARGLSEETLGRGDQSVRIPMQGSASSLNLAVAAGLLLYEARRGG